VSRQQRQKSFFVIDAFRPWGSSSALHSIEKALSRISVLDRHHYGRLPVKYIGKKFKQFRDQSLERKAREARDQSNAVFVGITGSSAKSTATGLLTHILSARGAVVSQVKFNNLRSIQKTVARSRRGYAFVVVEAGIGSRNSMQPMADVLRPDIAVVTMVAIEQKGQKHGSLPSVERWNAISGQQRCMQPIPSGSG
jgi:hypothetical protein